MQLIEWFIRNPVKVTVGVILIALFGVMSLFAMPMQLTPAVETPTITVETRWPGASSQEVEREIVQEQEEQLKSVEGVIKMSSESSDSMGRITLEFAVGADMSTALLKVNSNLQQVREYPEDADEPKIETSNLADRPVAWFVLVPRPPTEEALDAFEQKHPELAELLAPARKAHNTGLLLFRLRELEEAHPEVAALQEIMPAHVDIPKLKKFVEDRIESRFERVEGVSASNVIGGEEEEMQVVVDPESLAARQLTIDDLRWALRRRNMDLPGGDFSEGKRRWVVRTLGQFRSPEQVANLIVARRDGAPVYVRDVAEVRLGYKKPEGLTQRFGGMSIAINAQRETGANVLDVMEGLRRANAELNAGVLEQRGLLLEQVYDETDYIYSAIDLVVDNIVIGACLTFATLLLFLRSGRSTLIIGVHILISTIGAFLVMALAGRSLNVPALGGLAFAVGMLVDNAIVMLENIYRRHELGESAVTASVRGAKEVWGALLNASVVNLAVFLPVLAIEQEAGQLFRDIALAISASVGLSMLVAVAVVPTAAARLLGTHGVKKRPGWMARRFAWLRPAWQVVERYAMQPLSRMATAFVDAIAAINYPIQSSVILRVAVVAVCVGASSLLTWLFWPKVEYLPNGNRNLVIGMLLPPAGYNMDKLTEIGRGIESELQPYWEAEAGTPEAAELKYPPIGDFFYVARHRNLFLGLRSAEPLEAGRLVPLVQEVGSKVPGMIAVGKQTALFEQGLTSGRTVDIEISGPEITKLVELGGQIMGQVATVIPNAQALPRPSLDLNSPEVHVTPKWEQAADMGVWAVDLGYTVDALVDGAYAGDYFIGGDKIDLTIVGQSQFAQHTQDIGSMPVATPTGQLVQLAAVADIKLASGPEQINRREGLRAITIQVSPPPDVPLQEAVERIEEQIVRPLQEGGALENGAYHINLAGTADKLRDTWNALKWNLLLAVLITYLLMAALFESWLYPFVVITSVPLGAVGGVLGLQALNVFWLAPQGMIQSLDMLTMLGFVILVGTAVNNPILIVEQAIIHMREDGLPQREAIMLSVRNRIRPIFMTTISGLIGLFPLVVAPGAGSELYRGIGAVLLGGMLVSTVFTLVLVPALLSLALDAKAAAARLLCGRRTLDLDAEPHLLPEQQPLPVA